MEESPVGVKHSAGIVDTRDWVNALNGYQYDSMNRDALLNLATATADSCIALPRPGATLRFGHETVASPCPAEPNTACLSFRRKTFRPK